MHELFDKTQLPEGFQYPEKLISFLDANGIDIGPWQFLQGKWLKVRHVGLQDRYPSRKLIPFARRLDCDDVACFDVMSTVLTPAVIIIHDFASIGWEQREMFDNFDLWLLDALELAKEWD
jgi:hypothetical protein